MHRLWRRDGGVGIAHGGGGDGAALENQVRFDAEEHGLPQDQVGKLAHRDGTHTVRDAMGDGRVDGVLGDVALDAAVVVGGGVAGKGAPLLFILSAVCQERMITSPTRPMAWLSDAIMLKAPMS